MFNKFKAGFCSIIVMCILSSPVFSGEDATVSASGEDRSESSLWTRDTLTDNWFGLGEKLEENGISVGLGMTHVHQYNLHDGADPGSGAYSGSYDLEIEADMERLAGLDGGTLFMLAEGSWGEGDGLDADSVGSLFGINDDFGGDRGMDITELWYEQHFYEDRLRIRTGKIDLTGGFEYRGCPVAFDGNMYANDETAQFLNSSLVNNPAIPFPDNGLGIMVFLQAADGWYVALGAADAEADARETGFNTTFDGDTDSFLIAETGIVPMLHSGRGRLPGSYRLGIWNARIEKDYLEDNHSKRDDTGFYFSADQMIWRENSEDSQGMGLFTRVGWADEKVNEIEFSGSVGLQYKGIIPDRDNDVLGFGIAHGTLSDDAAFNSSLEQVYEAYYNVEISPWLHITPDLQMIKDPGGDSDAGDAFVAGVRVQMDF
jgi:porin